MRAGELESDTRCAREAYEGTESEAASMCETILVRKAARSRVTTAFD